MGFLDYKNVKRLKQLSKHSIDLTEKGFFNSARIKEFQTHALGFSLLYGSELIDEKILETLFDLAEEAYVCEKMEAMQKGAIINKIEGYPSENRKVMHTAMRDFFEDRISEPAALEASNLAFEEYQKLERFLEDIDKKSSFSEIVQIGIGGSDLGPRALYLALERFAVKGRKAHFISNVDPDDAASLLTKIDPKKALFVVVSKSGSTLETLTNELLIREQLQKKGLNPKDHLIAVTGKGSPMDDPSKYREVFYIWDYVGGRYSATSMVGGVMLAFTLGMDQFKQVLKGASEMDKHALYEDIEKNLPLISALLGIWNRNFLGHQTVAVIPYSQALIRFPAHLQQLDMESNGKSIDKEGNFVNYPTGPIVWGEVGTNGQHSFFQLLHQGTTIVPIEFIGFKKNQYDLDSTIEKSTSQQKLLSNLFAQSIALATGKKDKNPNKHFSGNRPNRVLLANHLTPKTMGALLSFYEHKVAFQGFVWNINSFDQEGVQLGKVLAKKMLELYAAEKKYPEGKAYVDALERV